MRSALLALLLLACGSDLGPDLVLAVRVPSSVDSQRLLASVATVTLRAERDGRVLAQAQAPAADGRVDLPNVPFGPGTQFILEGLATSRDVLARGRSCPLEFRRGIPPVPVYFAPTNFFADTVAPPAVARMHAVALPLEDSTGTVLLLGGAQPDGMPLSSAALYLTPSAKFANAPGQRLVVARVEAQIAVVPGKGAVVVGGLDGAGRALDSAEVFDLTTRAFSLLTDSRLGPRVGHRAVTLPDGRVLVVGGSDRSTVSIELTPQGAKVDAGPSLPESRREPAVVVAVGVPLVFGGFDPAGNPTSSIYALATPPLVSPPPTLQQKRAQATATLLDDGAILVVGGVADPSGRMLCDAELYNPISQTTSCLKLGTPRRGHTATPLDQGRVLIVGGLGDANSLPLASVELYVPGAGFVSERPLGKPRAGQVAVPLCDGTVLVVGGDADGAPSAEIYTPR